MTVVDGVLYFAARNAGDNYELWRSDGTSAGTKRVKDIRPGSQGSGPNLLVRVGDTLYFTANDGVHGSELWKSNGTAGGTKLVKDVNTLHT
jgi:ELWxxDGT repeat protein